MSLKEMILTKETLCPSLVFKNNGQVFCQIHK